MVATHGEGEFLITEEAPRRLRVRHPDRGVSPLCAASDCTDVSHPGLFVLRGLGEHGERLLQRHDLERVPVSFVLRGVPRGNVRKEPAEREQVAGVRLARNRRKEGGLTWGEIGWPVVGGGGCANVDSDARDLNSFCVNEAVVEKEEPSRFDGSISNPLAEWTISYEGPVVTRDVLWWWDEKKWV